MASRRHLLDLRVIQKNLVYVIGISARIASEQILSEPEYFGQFGRILKIVVNRRNTGAPLPADRIGGGATTTSGSAYVTYSRAEEAQRAIAHVDGSVFDGRILRATYGTTKYCSYFLRGTACPNSGCMYLHEEGETADSFTKEALSSGKMQLHSCLIGDHESAVMRQFGTIMFRPPSRPFSPPLVTSEVLRPATETLRPVAEIPRSASVVSASEEVRVVKTINLEQCQDETISFLSRLSRWNKSTEFDQELAKAPLLCAQASEAIISFDPFSEHFPSSSRHLERDYPSTANCPGSDSLSPPLSPHRIALDGLVAPIIATGTLPGFDWSASRTPVPSPLLPAVSFKNKTTLLPAPVGSPICSTGPLHTVSAPLERPSPDRQRLWVESLLNSNASNQCSSRTPPVAAPASKQWTSLLLSGVTGNSPAASEGRKAVDATQLEQQFFRESQPPLTPMAAPMPSNTPAIGKNDAPSTLSPTPTPRAKIAAAASATEAQVINPDSLYGGKKKVAPPPPIALARIKEATVLTASASSSAVPLGSVASSSISASTSKASARRIAVKTLPTPASPSPVTAKPNLFAVLDTQGHRAGSISGSSDGEKDNDKLSILANPTIVSNVASESRSKRKNPPTAAPSSPAVSSIDPLHAPTTLLRRPLPLFPSQPTFALHWPTPSNHYHPTTGPMLAQMADQERVSWRKWLDSEDKVNRSEETVLRAKLAKLHGEMASWMSSLVTPAFAQ